MTARVFARAKINLTLKVGRPRADGRHPLQSVVMFADAGDVIEATAADTLSLHAYGDFAEGLPAGDDNLVLRAAHALAKHARVEQPGATIGLEKSLPIASGIGGGSADAAAALRALNQLWNLNLGLDQLSKVAATLGADVPACLADTTLYMTGTGETWAPLAAPALSAVLVNPLTPLATADVYRKFDDMKLGADFREAEPPAWKDAAAAIAGMQRLGNDLEAPAQKLAPEIKKIATTLRADPRVRYAGLSGSGATMFAIVDDMVIAHAFAEELQNKRPNWWVREAQLGEP